MITLRPISWKDIMNLRVWNNVINTKEEQVLWYWSYLDCENDFIFIIDYKGVDVGCIGYRVIDGEIDIYNAILGDLGYNGKGIMDAALKQMKDNLKKGYQMNITFKGEKL